MKKSPSASLFHKLPRIGAKPSLWSMHIKRVIVHGFKSYNDTVVFGPFSEGCNAIVGLNGSGKSNFYQAIEFVLLDDLAQLRINDRKALLYEGQGQSALTAYVEIIFDNSARTIPIEKDEISIRRSIGLNKDEYFIDRKHSTQQEVHDLLETAGFSPSNGYYIVRQGKVQSLATMKDNERLDLLLDVAGTKFYDLQRQDSISLLAESDLRAKKIKDSIDYIASKLDELKSEKEELDKYEKLDREKRAVEYLIQGHNLSEIRSELDTIMNDKERQTAFISDLRSQSMSKQEELKSLKSQQKEDQNLLKDSELAKKDIERRKTFLIRNQTRNEMELKELTDRSNNSEKTESETKAKIESTTSEIAQAKEELKAANEEFECVKNRKAEVEGQIEGLTQICGGNAEDPETVKLDLKRAEECLEKLKNEENEAANELQKAKDELNKKLAKKAELESSISELQSQRLSEKKTQLMNQRKELWRTENSLEKELRKQSEKLEKAEQRLASSVPGDVSTGLADIKRMGIEGVFGPLYELISCDEELSLAISVVAKSRLFYVVVDTDETASKAINELNAKGHGQVTFMPLNRIEPAEEIDGVQTLLSRLSFDQKYFNAVSYIFGKVALCDSAKSAADTAAKYRINCVTKEGDFVSSQGPMTGGSRPEKKTLIELSAQISAKREMVEKTVSELSKLKEQISGIESEVTEIEREVTKIERDRQKIESEASDLASSIRKSQEAVDSKQREDDERRSMAEESQSAFTSIREKLALLESLSSQSGDANIEKLRELREEKKSLTDRYVALNDQTIRLRSRINDKLVPQLNRYNKAILGLDPESIKSQKQKAEEALGSIKSELDDLESQLATIEKEVADKQSEVSDGQRKIEQMQSELDALNTKLNSHTKSADKVINRIALLQQKEAECIKNQKEVGALPQEEVEAFQGQEKSDLYRHQMDINEEMKRYRHVNKKASEQFRAFTVQRQDLEARENELDENAKIITDLIACLDKKKDEAISHTFGQISENFAHVFSELVPHGSGCLSLQKDLENDENSKKYTGIALRVQFEGQNEPLTLQQLSGGQKSIAALAMLFAIQRFLPAPFYLFDEVDSALDPIHREAVAKLIHNRCHSDESPGQFILTTFKTELLEVSDKYFAIKYDGGHSLAVEIGKEDAEKIVTDSENAGH